MKREPFNYPIPHKYFPAVKVTKTFYAIVEYKVVARTVIIERVSFDPLCLQHIAKTAALVAEIKKVMQATEDKMQAAQQVINSNNHVPNTIMASIAPFIKY